MISATVASIRTRRVSGLNDFAGTHSQSGLPSSAFILPALWGCFLFDLGRGGIRCESRIMHIKATDAQPVFEEPSDVKAVLKGDMNGITLDRPRVIVDVNLLLVKDGKVLLGRRCGSKFANGMYSLPAGHLELGESVIAAMVREAQEEIGVVIDSKNVTFIQVMHNSYGIGRLAFFFEVRDWDGEIVNKEPEKCDDLRWFELDNLPTQMIPYIREAINRYIASPEPSLTLYGW